MAMGHVAGPELKAQMDLGTLVSYMCYISFWNLTILHVIIIIFKWIKILFYIQTHL